jgi:hypothetical protein
MTSWRLPYDSGILFIRQVLIPRFPTLNNSTEIAMAMASKQQTEAIIAGD